MSVLANSTTNGTSADSMDFDPFHQKFTIVGPAATSINISLDDVDDYMRYAVEKSVNQGTQVGATVAVLAILLLVTKAEKRKLPVFILNALSLLVNIPRTILQIVFFTSAWYQPYVYFAGDYSRIPRIDFVNTVAAALLGLVLTILVQASLILQVWTITATTDKRCRLPLMIISLLVAFLAVGLRFAITVINIQTTLEQIDPTPTQYMEVNPASQIAFSCSVFLFAAIFSTKLGYALVRRHKLGLKQFGPMQIIFIMSCQTMIIPAVFTVFQFTSNVPDLGSQALTLTAIFLPLSSIWAVAAIENRTPAPSAASEGRPVPHKSYNTIPFSATSDVKSVLSDGHLEKSLSIDEV